MTHIIGDLDDLILAIDHAGRGDAARELAEAQQRADRMLEEARAEAERVREERVRQARDQAAAQRREQRSNTDVAARHTYLRAREELLEQVWQQAEQRLRALPEQSEAYVEVLQRLARLAVAALGPGQLYLAADPAGHTLLTNERLEEWSQAASEVSDASVTFERADQPADTWGGLLITTADRRRRMDATFPTRLAIARDDMREAVFQCLMQEP